MDTITINGIEHDLEEAWAHIEDPTTHPTTIARGVAWWGRFAAHFNNLTVTLRPVRKKYERDFANGYRYGNLNGATGKKWTEAHIKEELDCDDERRRLKGLEDEASMNAAVCHSIADGYRARANLQSLPVANGRAA